MVVLMGIQSLRAGEPRVCPVGRAVFGKLTCTGAAREPIDQAYFFGATSEIEIRATYPERAEKFGDRCRKKLTARNPASLAAVAAKIEYRVETVDTCLGKRGYEQPCVRDDDCLERYCHAERGACSKVFTVPYAAP